ncbi:transaldolase [Saccharata proteae CBS 121410]|uniref:Transaldolase n=1 Tax=Saccharata proteae CBS 121410 TaxID=1314787 RepID=A0A6A5YCL6_9PEZI|nr:transaldolase [Saccharata proteae CBS 121410]
MTAPKTLLDLLRSRSVVDCDTLDVSVAAELGPFADCTSNQAIACSELQEHRHKELLLKSATQAKQWAAQFPDISIETLAVELGMINLSLAITPHLTGFSHLQANPYDAYSTPKTIAFAHRIVSLFRLVAPAHDTSRICIKIPATWEGLAACRVLETQGIRTLATTLFTLEQAALAAEVGCRYIAPYVNELKVHFEAGYTDPTPNIPLCVRAQRYYRTHGVQKTHVLPASLTSVGQVMMLAGADHITVAPGLLRELARIEVDGETERRFPSMYDDDVLEAEEVPGKMSWLDDEAGWRMGFTRANGGREEVKIVQAINIFCDMQDTLEALMKPLCAA